VRNIIVDRFNPFRDQFLGNNRAELFNSGNNQAAIRPFEPAVGPVGTRPPVPEPGTPPPNYLTPGSKGFPASGKTPPIYIPPVKDFRREDRFKSGRRLSQESGGFGRSVNQFAGPATRGFSGQAGFGRDRQFAGPATRGFSGQATIDRASPAQQVLNGVNGRRNVFNRLRGFQVGPRQGRGGRIPVFSRADAARRLAIARAGAATRPQVPVNPRYAPFINRANPRFQNLVNLL